MLSICCCKDEASAERITEAPGKAPTTLVNYDEGIPIYSPGPGSWDQNEDMGQAEFVAPPPQIDDYGGMGNDPLPPPAPVEATSKKEKKDQKTKGKAKKKDQSDEGNAKLQDSLTQIQQEEVHLPQENVGRDQKIIADDEALGTKSLIVETGGIVEEPAISAPPPKVFGHPGMTLQIELDTGWTEFEEEGLKQVNDHLKAGASSFAITVRGAMYLIDFKDTKNITQTNASTKKARKLRLANESALRYGDMVAPDSQGLQQTQNVPSAAAQECAAAAAEHEERMAKKRQKRCCVVS